MLPLHVRVERLRKMVRVLFEYIEKLAELGASAVCWRNLSIDSLSEANASRVPKQRSARPIKARPAALVGSRSPSDSSPATALL